MKKILFLTFLFGMLSQTELRASISEDDPIEDKGSNDNSGRPKGSLLSVQSTISGDEMYLEILNYVGDVQILTTSEVGGLASSSTHYINGRGNVTLDFSRYTYGHYSVEIIFSNGTVYEGSVWVF